MLAHLIQHKGKGALVILMPIIIGLLLAELVDVLAWSDRYVGATSFIASGIILFLMDNKRQTMTEGVVIQKIIKLPREKRKNTFIWIELRYWAMLLIIVGSVWLYNLII